MVSFRKSLLLIGLLVLMAGLASAQITPPLSCTANAGVPPIARAEGLAEEVGQVQIICTGGTRAAQDTVLPTINVQIFLNTNLTSRLYAASTDFTSGVDGTEALLLVDDPDPAIQRLCGADSTTLGTIRTGCPARANYGLPAGTVPPPTAVEQTYSGNTYTIGETAVSGQYNVFRGVHGKQTIQGLENSVTFLGIPFNPPGTAGVRSLRIVNVRANASQQAVLGAFGLPGSIQMVISISGTASLPLANPQLTVAFVQPGMQFTAGSPSFNQCDRPTGTGSRTPATGVTAFSNYFFDIKFQERFGTAFRIRGNESQNVPGQIYNTESMFTHTSRFGTSFGYAANSTRLQARFSDIPAGVVIELVPHQSTVYPSGSIPAAQFKPSTVLLNSQSGFTSSDSDATRLSVSGQAGTAVWNVTSASPNIIEEVNIRVYVWWSSTTTPGIGTATVRGDYSPQSTVDVATTAGAPRFLPSQVTVGSFTITPCQTNLLWPFVSNQAGFDTGLVISNTSLDPFGTSPQEGKCRIYYYGKTAAGATLNDWIETPDVVKAGEQFIWLLSGSNPGAGFQGYIIARCNFQYAHGFGFISDLGAQKLAMGYLALILDGQKSYADGRATRTAILSETLGQ